MPHLIIVHIGPVQEFIAAARRSRDLWFGSRLLSELAKRVARTIADEVGIESLIFPAPSSIGELDQDSPLDVANKIVASVTTDPVKLAEDAEKEMRAMLAKLVTSAYDAVGGEFARARALEQVMDLPEFYWVSVPYEGEDDYVPTRATAERLLAARKNTRAFRQPTWTGNLPKSSMDGARESIIPETSYPTPQLAREDREAYRAMQDKLYRDYRISGAERLSGVDLFKRRGEFVVGGERVSEGAEFPSTSHMAALPLLQRIMQQYRQPWQQYTTNLGMKHATGLHPTYRYPHTMPVEERLRTDGSILFARRLAEQVEEQGQDQAEVDRVVESLRTFMRTIRHASEPSPYYAILLGDGDNMGQTLDNLPSPRTHRLFSRQLGKFAQEARAAIQAHDGAVLYAGGDDVLALLPLHTALEAAKAVADRFRAMMDTVEVDNEKIEFRTADGRAPTFSAGLVIVHYLEPLSDALELARSAEKKAKQHESEGQKKNALAITSSKRSGADRTIAGHWDTLVPHMQQVVRFHEAELVPDGAAYQLQAVVLEVGGVAALTPLSTDSADERTEKTQLQEAVRHEAIRLLKRKRAQRGQEKLKDDVLSALNARIVRGGADAVMQTAQELVITKVFADARREASTPAKEPS